MIAAVRRGANGADRIRTDRDGFGILNLFHPRLRGDFLLLID
jgi:hypothetical protein